MKKKKPKKSKKTCDLEFDFVQRTIHSPLAAEFKFQHGLSVVALMLPSVGTIVIGSSGVKNPANCWRYPENTSMSTAVGMAFQEILEEASARIGTKK